MDPLLYWKHRLWVLAFHGGMAVGCAFSALHAVVDHLDILEFAVVGGTIAWLIGSWPTWKNSKVPWYLERNRRWNPQMHERRNSIRAAK
jgi:hypothetical protein